MIDTTPTDVTPHSLRRELAEAGGELRWLVRELAKAPEGPERDRLRGEMNAARARIARLTRQRDELLKTPPFERR
jgi:hypothetical protein